MKKYWIVLALLATCSAVAYGLKAQEPALPPEVLALISPGPNHKVLEAKVGKWDLKGKLMSPGSPPTECMLKSEVQWMLGGRYLQDKTSGMVMGMAFEGLGFSGYDNVKKKYVSNWMDNFGTGIIALEGTFDVATKTFSYSGEALDPAQSKYVKSRSTETIVDADHWSSKTWVIGADGKEFLNMEIAYTRAK